MDLSTQKENIGYDLFGNDLNAKLSIFISKKLSEGFVAIFFR